MKIFHGKFETLAYPTTTSIVTSDVRPAVCPSVRNSIYSDSHINKTLMGPRAREVSFRYYFGEIYGFVDNCLALEPLDACANLEFLPRIGWKAVCLFVFHLLLWPRTKIDIDYQLEIPISCLYFPGTH